MYKFMLFRSKGGFSIAGLMLTLAIISILMFLLMGALGEIQRSSRTVKCAANLRSYGLAVLAYSQEMGIFMPGYESGDNNKLWNYVLNKEGRISFEQQKKLYCPELAYSDRNHGGKTEAQRVREGYLNSIGYGYNFWLANKRPNTLDQPSSVALLMETTMLKPIIHGNMWRDLSEAFAFRHRGAANVFYCDGHLESWRQEKPHPDPYPVNTDKFWSYPPITNP